MGGHESVEWENQAALYVLCLASVLYAEYYAQPAQNKLAL
jgi:hypothetical protein